MESKGLIVGEKYRVHADDCCLEIDLHGVFLGWELKDEDSDGEYKTAVFDFGKVWGYDLHFEKEE